MCTILLQNYAVKKQKSYEITTTEMSATLDEAKPDTGNTWGLNFKAAENTSIQMPNCHYSKG